MSTYQAIIIGKGLAGLAAAARLTELGMEKLLVVGDGYGGTPYIAAINFVLPDNPAGDSPELYAEDMLKAGYSIGNKQLVRDMAENSIHGYELLRRFGVEFAMDGVCHKFRHLSGHSIPRSLCCTTELIGAQMVRKLVPALREKGVQFADKRCVRLLSDGEQIYGVTLLDRKHFNKIDNVYAPVVIAAWGGVGAMFERTTYPADVSGENIARAWLAGAALTDLEFIEYEPMVVIAPDKAVGEPCPTAMLGEGAYLRNSLGERFLLKERPQGEAGTPKSLINRMIWQEVNERRGSPRGGVYVDMRHLSEDTLKGYPWFYQRLMAAGVNPKTELVEVGPMAHSHSGGVQVGRDYQSCVKGFYAVGEAAGGVHGACRCGGNAASQAVVSGYICAEAVMRDENTKRAITGRRACERRVEIGVYQRLIPEIRNIAAYGLGICRSEESIRQALDDIERILKDKAAYQDEDTLEAALAVKLVLLASLRRQESRGVFRRTDFSETDEAYLRSLPLSPKADAIGL